jgi:hypothetical protein
MIIELGKVTEETKKPPGVPEDNFTLLDPI